MGLDIRIKIGMSVSLIEEFAQILSVINLWDKKQGTWHNIKIFDMESSRDNCIFQSKGEFTGEDILTALDQYSSLKYLRFYANTAHEYVECEGQNLITRLSPMALTFSTRESRRRFGENPDIEGDYGIYFHNVSPYVFPYTEKNVAVQSAVETNLEALLKLLTDLAVLDSITSFKVFSDSGNRLPFNAHLAFYVSEAEVETDLDLMRELWNSGLANYNIPPLRDTDFAHERFLVHEWRSAQMRENLRNRMERFLDEKSHFDYKRIKDSGAFDTIDLNRGFILLEYPHFVNAFLDRFYFFK